MFGNGNLQQARKATHSEPKVSSVPEVLYVEVTSRCNLRCTTCPRNFFDFGKPMDVPFEKFRRWLSELPGVRRVVLHGLGEPLLHPQIADFVRAAKDASTYVLFNTNAVLLSESKSRQLIEAGLDELRVSIDAPKKEIYEKMRRGGRLDVVYKNVSALLKVRRKLGRRNPKVSFWMTGTKENVVFLPKLVKDAAKLGVEEVYLQRLVIFGQGDATLQNSVYLSQDESVRNAIEEAIQLGERLGVRVWGSGDALPTSQLQKKIENHPWKKCQRPYTTIYIQANGLVLPCCIAPFSAGERLNECILGDANRQNLLQIWRGEKYEKFRKKFLSDDPPVCCKSCGSLWSL